MPPGSGRLPEEGVFDTVMVGGTFWMVTVASSSSEAVLPSSSVAVAVTVLAWTSPGTPVTGWVNEQV
jgi:hypothetical protein